MWCGGSGLPELGLALLVEAVDKAVGLALQRPPQGHAAPAAQILRATGECLHGLGQAHKLPRAEALQGAILGREPLDPGRTGLSQ